MAKVRIVHIYRIVNNSRLHKAFVNMICIYEKHTFKDILLYYAGYHLFNSSLKR